MALLLNANATYHEGAGNDFVVVVDLDAALQLGPEIARAICSRNNQHGADGFIAVRRGTNTDLEMQLWNADGSVAEMSGNGIRCLAQAAVLAGAVTSSQMTVLTGAGVRHVTYTEDQESSRGTASVTMGEVVLGEFTHQVGATLARRVSVGNPHLVLVVDDAVGIDPMIDGPSLSTEPVEGTNVEWITPKGSSTIDFVVYERGAGPTKACGTGSCAAAVVAHEAGLVDAVVMVRNPGGTLTVDCSNRHDVVLSGPVTLLGHERITIGEQR